MNKMILGWMFLASSLANAQSVIPEETPSCRPGYSVGLLGAIQNDAADVAISEVRGSGLFYLLQVELSKVRDPQHRSARNTIQISATHLATADSGQVMTTIADAIKAKKVAALCVRVDPNSSLHPASLPPQFRFRYGDDFVYELDLLKPFP